jgi:NAD-dependent deacetylase
MKQKIIILSGAGMSAESGLKTFRDTDGLWEGHSIEDVATPAAWIRNPVLVLDFYNQRRAQLKAAHPNAAHLALVQLESRFNVMIVTQNVDDLHERAGSSNIIHLHGELFKVRSSRYADLIYEWHDDLLPGQLCEKGAQLRPHIVWFGEEVPMLGKAISECLEADYCIIIGTSMQVYPAASLVRYLNKSCRLYYIDPRPHISPELSMNHQLKVIKATATEGVTHLVHDLLLQ